MPSIRRHAYRFDYNMKQLHRSMPSTIATQIVDIEHMAHAIHTNDTYVYDMYGGIESVMRDVWRAVMDGQGGVEEVERVFGDLGVVGRLAWCKASQRMGLKGLANQISSSLKVSWWTLIDLKILEYTGLDATLQILAFHAGVEPNLDEEKRSFLLTKLKSLTETRGFDTIWNEDHYQSMLQFIFLFTKNPQEFEYYGGNRVRFIAKKPSKSLAHFMTYEREQADDIEYLAFISADNFEITNWLWSLPHCHLKIASMSNNSKVSCHFLAIAIEMSIYDSNCTNILHECENMLHERCDSNKILFSNIKAKRRLMSDVKEISNSNLLK
jgi:hypothetical protein